MSEERKNRCVTYNRQQITLTVWKDEICFSQAALNALNGCERVRIEVNPTEKCILVIPVTVNDKDNVRWASVKKEVARPRKIHCSRFTKLLYDTWGWDRVLAYKAEGKVVMANQKVMLLFDFNKAANWTSQKAGHNG